MTLEFTERLDTLEELALKNFSYSRIDTFNRCQLRYYYAYILKIPQEYGHAALLGNIIHKALEVSAKENTLAVPRELIDNYEASIDELDPEHRIPMDMIDSGHTMLLEFIRDLPEEEKKPDYQPEYGKDFYTELAFSVPIARGRFNGYIDKVDVTDKLVTVTDYKSGKWEETQKSIPTNLQLGIYSLVASKIWVGADIYSQLYYLRSGKKKGHLFTEDDIDGVKVMLSKKVGEILRTQDFHPTPVEFNCRWCSYATDGTCATGAYRLRKKER